MYDIGVEDAHEFTANGVVVHNCYKDAANPVDGWLKQDFIEQKKREVSRERWRVEYDLGEPSIGNRAIDSEAVNVMFDVGAPHPLKHTRDHQEYQVLRPDVTREYVISADWARDVDWTVIGVWDVTDLPIRLAYYVRLQRRPYPFMIGLFNTLQRRYHAEGIHDATGLGSVVADLIDDRVRNFLMTGRQRDDMLSEFVAAVENKKIRASRIDSFYSACLYASTDDLFSRAKEFHLPDEICSAALAWKMVSHRFPTVMPYVAPKVDVNWMGRAVNENTYRHPTQFEHGQEELTRTITGEVKRKDEDQMFSLS